jgi:hypothetical protein
MQPMLPKWEHGNYNMKTNLSEVTFTEQMKKHITAKGAKVYEGPGE